MEYRSQCGGDRVHRTSFEFSYLKCDLFLWSDISIPDLFAFQNFAFPDIAIITIAVAPRSSSSSPPEWAHEKFWWHAHAMGPRFRDVPDACRNSVKSVGHKKLEADYRHKGVACARRAGLREKRLFT